MNDEPKIIDPENFTQLCVWNGTTLGDSTTDELVEFFKKEFNARIQFKCEVETLPDLNEDGSRDTSGESGGRSDLMFYVHKDDVGHFAVPRLKAGIRWWEDVVKYNDNRHLYTAEFLEANPPTW